MLDPGAGSLKSHGEVRQWLVQACIHGKIEYIHYFLEYFFKSILVKLSFDADFTNPQLEMLHNTASRLLKFSCICENYEVL